jgi:flagellar protein FliL
MAAKAGNGEAKGGMMGLIAALLAVGIIGGGAGAGLAFMLPAPNAPPAAAKPEATAEAPAGTEEKAHADAAVVAQRLEPIVGNLSTSATWIRLEATLLIDAEAESESATIAAKASNDIQAFLRTLVLGQIEGPSGFLHFREDLLDLVQTGSGGKVRDIAIASMVVE